MEKRTNHLLAALLVLSALPGLLFAQKASTSASFSLGGAQTQAALFASINKSWQVGKRERFLAGAGLRFNSYLGKNQYYVTAPAKLTSGETGPQVLFIENITVNMDTFLIQTAQVNSLNIMINLSYLITSKITAGFDIDAIGFSFGKRVRGNYINGFEGKNTSARPTSFNILLVSDNDIGMLNSEFYLRYALNEKWSVQGALQFLFTEYTTGENVQEFPEPNDRFRRKSLLFAAGVSYKIN